MCVSEVYSVLKRYRSPGNINSGLHNIFKILICIRILDRHVQNNAKKVKLNNKKSEVIKGCFFMTFVVCRKPRDSRVVQ